MRNPQVALPIPEPKGFQAVDNYKIQLTFDGAHVVVFSRIQKKHSTVRDPIMLSVVQVTAW